MKELVKIINFGDHSFFYLTFKRRDADVPANTFFVIDPKRNVFKFIINFFQTLKIMLRKRPKVIISIGAGVVIPACYIGKYMGAKIIYIESFSRIWHPSLSGRIIYPIADLFFVQWEELKSKYPKAVFAGRLK